MTNQQAVMAFSQSEKIKSGLIWVSQAVNLLQALPGPEAKGGERVVRAIIEMMRRDLELAKKLAEDPAWEQAEKFIEKASVMMDSQVFSEAAPHLTQALSHVTGIGHRSMTHLKDQGLL